MIPIKNKIIYNDSCQKFLTNFKKDMSVEYCKKRVIKQIISCVTIIAVLTSCIGKNPSDLSIESDYEVVLEKVTRSADKGYTWSQARSAVIPSDTPIVVTTMSQTFKSGSDVYHDFYEIVSRDLGETWIGPSVIPSLKVYKDGNGYRSMADMWPQWHSASEKIINIGTSPFYSDNITHEGQKTEVVYSVYDPETEQWGPPKKLHLPYRDHDDMLLMAPAAGCAQFLVLQNGDVLLPIYYLKISDAKFALTNKESFSVSNMMKDADVGYTSTIIHCSFDGEELSYKQHGSELTLNQGRGIYEPSIAYFKGEYFLTLRSDKTAYVARSLDGLNFEPMKEWVFDNDSILGSYNTQQHWITHSDALYLAYTRKGANNDEVFRHRAPLFMAKVDTKKLQVIRDTERIIVPNRGVDVGNFGVADINENETWVTVVEYMRNETNVEADNSLFMARIIWKNPNELKQMH